MPASCSHSLERLRNASVVCCCGQHLASTRVLRLQAKTCATVAVVARTLASAAPRLVSANVYRQLLCFNLQTLEAGRPVCRREFHYRFNVEDRLCQASTLLRRFETVRIFRGRLSGRWRAAGLLPFLLMLTSAQPSSGYAVFTHEELIDLAWNDSIRPLLLHRFPNTTEAQLEEAHAYAYGGCVIQDLGYYPFGKEIFSNLTHYVRTGDFVMALLRDSRTVNEYAFAIGALSHYIGDSIGHSDAINPGTALIFPKLAKKYGSVVTYEEAPYDHVRVEFGFDVAQISRHRYAPGAYHKYIGFRVSRTLLDRAFYETYGLSVRGILGPQRSAIGSYRYSVRRLLPLFARGIVVILRGDIPGEIPNPARAQFLSALARADYQKNWSHAYRSPGFTGHVVAIVIRIIPKIGFLKTLSIKAPTPVTEALYIDSMNTSVEIFRKLLARAAKDAHGDLDLANRDLDTGGRVRPGDYVLTDKTYAELLSKVTDDKSGLPIPVELRQNILDYYSDPNAPISTRKHRKQWEKVQAELRKLRQTEGTVGASASQPSFSPVAVSVR